MARIVLLQHHDQETPGILGSTLRDHGFRLDVRQPVRFPDDPRHAVPADLDNLHGLVVMGGPMNTSDSHAFLNQERTLIRMAHEAGLPVVGVCLGAQQIAAALGGSVAPMDKPRVEVSAVELTVPGQTETIHAGIPWSCPAIHTHGHEVTQLPGDSVLLSSSAGCKHQAFRVGLRTFGFQHHFEADRELALRLFEASSGIAEAAGVTEAQFTAQLEQHADMLSRANERLCSNIATFAFSFDELLAV